jgi:small-conductance mechanosensitive channel
MTAKPNIIAADFVAFPEQFQHLTANTYHWLRTDSLTAAIGIGAAILLYLVFIGIRMGACRILGDGHDIASWRGFVRRMVGRTRSFFLGVLSANLVARFVAPPGPLLSVIGFLFTIGAAVQGAVWVREFILGLVERRASIADEDHYTLTSAMNIIRVLVNVVVWSIAAILVLDNVGVNVTGLVAGLGVGGIAIGLAAQGIFGDLFAALAILFDRPFRVGDTIRFGDVIGTVEAIGLKTVRIRANTGEQVIISNAKLLELQIRNLRRIETRTTIMTFQLDLGATAAQLRGVPAVLEQAFAAIEDATLNRANVVNVTAVAFEVEVEFVVHHQALKATLDAKQAAILATIEGFAKLGLMPADTTPRSIQRGPVAEAAAAADATAAASARSRAQPDSGSAA